MGQPPDQPPATPAPPAPRPSPDEPRVVALADAPVFVVGAPRSGTTWVQRLLLAHPAVCGGQESHFFTTFARVMKSVGDRDAARRDVGLGAYWTRDAFEAEVRRLWRATMAPMVAAAAPAATVLVEKTPEHATQVAWIARVLPAARFVHVVRDSRAVAASMFAARRHAWGRWAPGGVWRAARKWTECVTAARDAGRVLGPARYVEVRYEDLFKDALAETARLLTFCGLPVTPDGLRQIVDSQQFDKQVATGGSAIPVAGGLATRAGRPEPAGFFNQGKPDTWRRELWPHQKLALYALTRRLLREYGYDRR